MLTLAIPQSLPAADYPRIGVGQDHVEVHAGVDHDTRPAVPPARHGAALHQVGPGRGQPVIALAREAAQNRGLFGGARRELTALWIEVRTACR